MRQFSVSAFERIMLPNPYLDSNAFKRIPDRSNNSTSSLYISHMTNFSTWLVYTTMEVIVSSLRKLNQPK